MSRWAEAYKKDFLARMIWSVTDSYKDANHHPHVVLNQDTTVDILSISAKTGETVSLTADGSSDPDGDSLEYSRYVYRVGGTYSKEVAISGRDSIDAKISVPEDSSIHVILEICDSGSPQLYAYRRIINVE